MVDPPRAGIMPKALLQILSYGVPQIVYVSCNPASLARDIAILDELGYKAMKVQPVDMFPCTSHVECVTLLQRKES